MSDLHIPRNGSHHEHSFLHVLYDGNEKENDGVFLGLVIGISLATLFLLLGICIAVFRCCCRNGNKAGDEKRLLNMQATDDSLSLSSKSAPTTRSSSPCFKTNKDLSSMLGGPLVRSITLDALPNGIKDLQAEVVVPGERIQTGEEKNGDGMTQYMHTLVGHLHADYRSSTDDEEDPDAQSQGQLWFSLFHDINNDKLTVSLYRAKLTRGRGRQNSLRDPFVKVYLLPDERAGQQSKVVKKTLTPVYNQTFLFDLAVSEVRSRLLRFTVYDVDRRRVRHCLGHVIFPLANTDLSSDEVLVRDLDINHQSSPQLGDMSVSLCYIPNKEKLRVTVNNVSSIRAAEELCDEFMYIKVSLYYGQRANKSKKTASRHVAEGSNFEQETFSFTVPCKQLESCSVRLSLMLTCEKTADIEHGRVILGSYIAARGEALRHWHAMCTQTREVVTRDHQLMPPSRRSSGDSSDVSS